MKILMVNKFLYPKGGAETYVHKLGEILSGNGHEVQYFGLRNAKNDLGNKAGAYVSNVDFSTGIWKNLGSPFRIIYSVEARREIRKVLEDFQPDIVHLNNIQFHLTPSIILEIHNYRKKVKNELKIIYTAHDYQLICPSHGLFDNNIQVCEKCLKGNYLNCTSMKCIKGSALKSLIGTIDAYVWKWNPAYRYIDKIICCSRFLKSKLDTQERFRNKTVVLHNFVENCMQMDVQKEDYILEFGHLSKEKGTNTLLKVAERMPDVQFVFAGYGAAVKEIEKVKNARYVGFRTGNELQMLIRKAKISIYPSEWYENCPFSVIESQMFQTPVIGSRMGGIPELIRDGETGFLFEAGNDADLESKICKLLYTPGLLERFSDNCRRLAFESPESYYEKLMRLYMEN